MKRDAKLVILLLVLAAVIIVVPLFALKGAEFGGSDDAGSVKVEELQGEYEPWFTPVFETALNGKSRVRWRAFYSVCRQELV